VWNGFRACFTRFLVQSTKGGKAMGKRANGEGSIIQRKDGRWMATLTLDGKRRYFYGNTQKEALEKRRASQREHAQGILATGPTQTLNVYLKHWLEDVHKPTVSLRTYLTYCGNLNNYILPTLGHIQLRKLTPQHVQSFYAKLLKEGLSASTIKGIHGILHGALDNAVRWNLVSRNVSGLVKKPRIVKHKIHPLTEEQVRTLLDAVKGDVLEGIITVTLVTGLRRGEVLGLKWEDIDLENKYLYVRRSVGRAYKYGIIESEPKTKSGLRVIKLPNIVVDVIREHKVRQDAVKIEIGDKWQDSGYVFCNGKGKFLDASQLQVMYKRLLKRTMLPNIRFHDLRHSAATIMISMGVNPKVVQEILGHSTISMTMDTYAHVLPSMQEDATQKLNDRYK